MGLLSRFEGRMENTIEGTAEKMGKTPISPVQIMKKAEKAMRHEKIVGSGKQYAPTLYTVLVNVDDDDRLFGYYPTLVGEAETYLAAKAAEYGLVMDGQPLVRFIADENLKHGKFDVIAEMVAAPIIAELRQEENARYGIQGYNQPPSFNPNPGMPSQAYPGDMPEKQAAAHAMMNNAAPYQQQSFSAPIPAQRPTPMPAQQAAAQAMMNNAAPYQQQSFSAPTPAQMSVSSSVINNAASPVPQQAYGVQSGAGQRGFESVPVYPNNAAQSPQDEYMYNAFGVNPSQGAPGRMNANQNQVPHSSQSNRQTVLFSSVNNAPQTPAPSNKVPCLAELSSRRLYEIVGSKVTLGRESVNDIQVVDINASRRHAEILKDFQGNWVLNDLGSTNGTFLNGSSVSSSPLQFGDQICIGTTKFVFTLA